MAIKEKMRINNHLLLPVLPTDITIDILSRLSVDSVLSCKRVCKSWRALIDDTAFAQAHTNRFLQLDDDDDDDEKKQQQQKSVETFECFLSTGDTDFGKYNFGEHTLGDITIKLHKLITHDYPFPLPFENNDHSRPYWSLVSSCNGLVCLVSKAKDDDYNSYICVYNPLTREYVNLPILTYKRPLRISNFTCRPYIITGFGYHPCTKEYKVVQIYYNSSGFGQGQVSVYTLGSGSSNSSSGWRSKGETNLKLFGNRGHLLVNGALHWLNHQAADRRLLEIIAFDLAEEKFRIVPSPLSAIFPQQGHVQYITLGVLENLEGRCLCVMTLIRTSSNGSLCSMWVMNQDDCSWTKKYNIALNERIHYRPLAHWKGGKILLQNYDKMEIVSSDLKNPSFDDEDINVISLARLSKKQLNAPFPQYEITPYTKSFVSLKALGEDGARTGKKTKELKRVGGASNDGEEQTMAAEKRNKNNQGEGEGEGETNIYWSTLARDVPFAGLMVTFYESLRDLTEYGKQRMAPNTDFHVTNSIEGLLLGGLSGGRIPQR